MNRKAIIIFITTLAVVAIVMSLIQAGSPKQVRWQQYDQQKVADLQRLQQAITDYAYMQLRLSSSTTNLLPKQLGDLNNLNLGQLFLIDPMTKQPYSYQVIDNIHYQLCAEFLTAAVSDQLEANVVKPTGNWDHPAGYYCFDQAINIDQLKLDRNNYPLVQPPSIPFSSPD